VIIPVEIMVASAHPALTYWGMILAYLILNIPLASILLGNFFLSPYWCWWCSS
jgi:ABC-type glycerol-3-phosphate transport system permease component